MNSFYINYMCYACVQRLFFFKKKNWAFNGLSND